MSTPGKSLIRSVGLTALTLCLLLAVIPLYFVPVPDGLGPHWSTVFDLPSDWYCLSSGLIGGRWLPHATVLLLRYATLLLVGGTISICVFKRFRLRWVPLLFLGLLTAELTLCHFLPRLGDTNMNPVAFGLLAALSATCFCLVLLHFLCRDS